MPFLEDFTGVVFGNLRVLGVHRQHPTSKGLVYDCICSCDVKKLCKHFDLKHGRAKSCGCSRWVPRVSKSHRAAVVSYHKYKNKAWARDLPFELTPAEFEKLVMAPCHYCGTLPEVVAGVDRKNSDLGYIKGNILPCCGQCNFAKSDTTYEEFLSWIRRVYECMVHI